ncbi:MAG: FAD-dependent oxidoreductase, partial [Sphingobium sp.]
MRDFDFDLFVIGAGSGGVRASRIAASHGARVAVAEEYRVGGTCVIRGCVPKKMLVYGAHFAEDLADARRFGWDVPDCAFDWKVLRDNVLADVDRLNGLYQQTLDGNKVTTFHERARISGPNEVMLASGKTVSAGTILIATGSWPIIPDIPGAEHGITSNEVFHLDALPKRVVIAGGGYIANEFAGIFNELGSEVTLVNRSDQILRGYDEQIRDKLVEISSAKGITFRLNAPFERVEKAADGTLTLHVKGGDPIVCDMLIFATGRKPMSFDLGLESVGVAMKDNGAIIVDDYNRTNVPGIYAVGDVTDRVQLTPVAIREGHAFADTVFGNNPRTVDYDCIPSAVFSHP